MAAVAACTVRSIALKSLNAPPNVPKGVRTADKKTTSRAWPWVFTGSPMRMLWVKDEPSPMRGELLEGGARVPALSAARLAHASRDPVANLTGSHRASDVSRTDALADRRVDRILDGSTGIGCAEVREHHGERENRRHWI